MNSVLELAESLFLCGNGTIFFLRPEGRSREMQIPATLFRSVSYSTMAQSGIRRGKIL